MWAKILISFYRFVWFLHGVVKKEMQRVKISRVNINMSLGLCISLDLSEFLNFLRKLRVANLQPILFELTFSKLLLRIYSRRARIHTNTGVYIHMRVQIHSCIHTHAYIHILREKCGHNTKKMRMIYYFNSI